MQAALRPARPWFFTKLFAAVAFFAGGGMVFLIGFRAFNPPPPGPGGCGNEVLGGMLVMLFGTPLGAIVCSLGGALLGCIVDFLLRYRAPIQPEGKPAVDALVRLLDDPMPNVRENALGGLEAIAPREVLESALARLLNDADESVRDAAKQIQKDRRERKK